MTSIEHIANQADVIINGYAVSACAEGYRVDNLNNGVGAAVFQRDGSTVVQEQGVLNDREVRKIQEFIKEHYKEMYLLWQQYSEEGFYGEDGQSVRASQQEPRA